MKLSKKFAGAVAEGWHAFRAALFAKAPLRYKMYHTNYEPKGDLRRGDLWVTDPDNFVYIWTGRRWKGVKEKKNARTK